MVQKRAHFRPLFKGSVYLLAKTALGAANDNNLVNKIVILEIINYLLAFWCPFGLSVSLGHFQSEGSQMQFFSDFQPCGHF